MPKNQVFMYIKEINLQKKEKEACCIDLDRMKNKGKRNIPAKFKFTRWSTCHMHAPLVFLNWSLALGTWL